MRHRLVVGVLVDLLDRDAAVGHSCDEGMVEVMGRKVTGQLQLSDIKLHVKD